MFQGGKIYCFFMPDEKIFVLIFSQIKIFFQVLQKSSMTFFPFIILFFLEMQFMIYKIFEQYFKTINTFQMLTENEIVKKINQRKLNSHSLLEILQIYDEVIGENHISRTGDIAIHIYEQILYDYAISEQEPQIYASPTHKKHDQDVELFSFSKPSALDFEHGVNKNYQVEVSEFDFHGNQGSSISILKNYLRKKQCKIFLNNLAQWKRKTRKYLQQKSAQYYSTYRTMKKIMQILKQLLLEKEKKQKLVKLYLQGKGLKVLRQFFENWNQYTFRSQQEKRKEKEIQQKEKNTIKKIAFIKIIKNYCEIKESIISGSQRDQQARNIKQKIITFQRQYYFRRALKQYQLKKTLKKKRNDVIKMLQKEQCNIFLKLLQAYISLKDKNLAKKVESYALKRNGKRFIFNLKSQEVFQKVYWKNPQKIIFLEKIFDLICFKLRRKGYNFSWMNQYDSIILNHPASKYVKRHILSTYFMSFKGYFKDLKKKMTYVKYTKVGIKILERLRNTFENSQIITNIDEKQEVFIQFLKQDRIKKCFHHFKKNKKYMRLHSQIMNVEQKLSIMKIQKGFKFMKAYRLAKLFYKKKIFNFSEKYAKRFVQTCFLEWKLYFHKNIHNKLLVNHFRSQRNQFLKKQIFEFLKQTCIETIVMKKKTQNTLKIIRFSKGQIFINNLKVIKREGKISKIKNTAKNADAIKNSIKCQFFQQFYLFYKRNSIYKSLKSEIKREYLIYHQRKAWQALKVHTSDSLLEKDKIREIEQIVSKRRKSFLFDKMIEIVLKKVIYRRIPTIFARVIKRRGFNAILQIASQRFDQ